MTNREALETSLQDEALAHTKYSIYEKNARKEGLNEIADFFARASREELGHAEQWLKELGGIGTTGENLRTMRAGENADYTIGYPEAAKAAENEGNTALAERFRRTAEIEKGHEKTIDGLMKDLAGNRFHQMPEAVDYRCVNCGCTVTTENAPDFCPVCGYPKRFFVRVS